MDDRRMEGMTSTADTGRRLAESAQDAASRATTYVQAGMDRVSERAQDLAHDASVQVERLTGRPLQSWTTEARRYIQEHPLQAIAITVGVGYVVGKMLKRG
jgi:ElaB/YqjD/DUF883 family membrane-anchored ribosome-binding protein